MDLEKMLELQKQLDEQKRRKKAAAKAKETEIDEDFSEDFDDEIPIYIEEPDTAQAPALIDDDALRQYFQRETFTSIKISMIRPFESHPFRLYEGERLDDMVASIEANGILQPVIVRRISDDEQYQFEMLSGHNRMNAAKIAGMDELPAVIKEDLGEEDALMYVVESNLIQRSFSDMLVSEQAKIIAMRYDEMFSQGKRNDIFNELKNLDYCDSGGKRETSSPMETKLRSDEKLAVEYSLSRAVIARLIRIDKLPDTFKLWIDEKKISVRSGVALSYIKPAELNLIAEHIPSCGFKLEEKKANELRRHSGRLTEVKILEILSSEKSNKPAGDIKIRRKVYSRFFAPETKPQEIEETIVKALEMYFKNNSMNHD